MQWQKLKGFGDFESDNYSSYYPIDIEYLSIDEVINAYVAIIAEFPGYKRYRITKHEIARRHCSNCNPVCEWVLEGTDE